MGGTPPNDAESERVVTRPHASGPTKRASLTTAPQIKSPLLKRYLAGAILGLALTAAFPTIGLWPLAWVAPGMLVGAAIGAGPANTFRIGYVAGLVQWLSTLYWLLLIPVAWYPILGWLALGAYLALYPATWLWLVTQMAPVKFSRDSQGFTGGLRALARFAEIPVHNRVCWALAAAAAWVALEIVRTHLLTGFPWLPLGASQYKLVPLIQIASVTGVYGVSFLLVWCSVSILLAVGSAVRTNEHRLAWLGDVFLPGAVLLGLFIWGTSQLGTEPTTVRKIEVAMVQPSIPQTMIWDPRENAARFTKIIELSKAALAGDKPDLLIWPEAALPSFDETTYTAITNLVVTHRVWMIFGADEAEARADSATETHYDYFNSAILLSPSGQFIATYRKRHLVMFGEYIPLRRWLPFLGHFTPIQTGFTPGTQPVQFELDDLGANISALICFEDIFPGLARKSVRDDTDFLLNLTNNGWFRESAAQWQHAVSALFRAVENGLPIVRCSNNGLTCWVDAHGRIRRIFRDEAGTIYGNGILKVQVPLRRSGQLRAQTFYTRHGDMFAWGCFAVTIAIMLKKLLARKRQLDA